MSNLANLISQYSDREKEERDKRILEKFEQKMKQASTGIKPPEDFYRPTPTSYKEAIPTGRDLLTTPQQTTPQPGIVKKVATGIAKTGARVGLAVADIATEGLDFVSDYITRSGVPKAVKAATPWYVRKMMPQNEQVSSLEQNWKDYYDSLSQKGIIPFEKAKSVIDKLQESEFIQPRKEWQEMSIKDKLTKNLPETLYTLGPSAFASIGMYAVNMPTALTLMATSTANNVKDLAIKYGVKEDKAEKLGLFSGALIGAVDAIVPSSIFGKSKSVFMAKFVPRVIEHGVLEAGTETIQEGIQLAAEKTFRDDLGWDEGQTRVALNAFMGGIAGSGMSLMVKAVNSGREQAGKQPTITPELRTQTAPPTGPMVTPAPPIQTALPAPPIQTALPAPRREGTVPVQVAPSPTPQAGFQIIDPQKAGAVKNIAKLLQEQLVKKQQLVSSGRATKQTFEEIEKTRALIKRLETNLEMAKRKQIVTTGPIIKPKQQPLQTPTTTQQPVASVPPTQQATQQTAQPVPPTQQATQQATQQTTQPVAPTQQVTQQTAQPVAPTKVANEVRVDKLYVPIQDDKVVVDNLGNVGLSTSLKEGVVEIDTSNKKILEFTTPESFQKAINNKEQYQKVGYDILKYKNDVVAITPRKFANAYGRGTFTPGKQKPRRVVITQKQAYENRKKVRKATKGGKTYAQYLKEASEKEQVKTETPEQIRERLVREKERYADFLAGKTKRLDYEYYSKEDNSPLSLPGFGRDRRGSASLKHIVETPFKVLSTPSTVANTLDKVFGKVIGERIYSGLEKLELALSKGVRIPIGRGDKMTMFYPFEFLTGAHAKAILTPHKQTFYKMRAEAKEKALAVGDYLKDFTTQEQTQIVEKIIKRDYNDNTRLSEAAKFVEQQFTDVGQQLVDLGLMQQEVFDEYLGTYFPRMFKFFEEQKGFVGPEMKRKAGLEFLKVKHDKYGVTYREGNKLVTKKFETRGERDAFSKELRKEGRKYETFAPLSLKKQQELQVITTASYPAVKRIYQENLDVAKITYFNTVAQDSNIASESQDIEGGFVKQIPLDKRYGNLQGMYVHENVISNFKSMVELPGNVDAFFRWANVVVKSSKTVLDSGVVSANLVSNFFLADLAGVPLTRTDYWTRNLYNALKGEGAYRELQKMGQIGKTMAGEEFREFLNVGDKEIESFKKELFLHKDGTIWDIAALIPKLGKKGIIKAGDLYSFSEDWAKATCYDWALNELKMSQQDAIKFAQDAIFDYSEVAPIINLMRRSPMGVAFPTFVAKMTKAGIKAQITKPFTVAKWQLMFGMVAATALAHFGLTKDEYEKIKPEYAGQWSVPIGVNRNKQGRITDVQVLDFSRMLPWGQITEMPIGITSYKDVIFNPILGSWKGTQGLISAFEPGGIVLNPLYEVKLNYSDFYQQKIYEDYDSPQVKMFKSIDYLQRAWLPSMTPPLVPGGKGGTTYEKIYNAFKGIPSSQGTTLAKTEAMMRVFGAKITHVDPAAQFKFAEYDIQKQIDEALKERVSARYAYANAMKRENTSKVKSEATLKWNETSDRLFTKVKELREEISVLRKARDNFFKTTTKK